MSLLKTTKAKQNEYYKLFIFVICECACPKTKTLLFQAFDPLICTSYMGQLVYGHKFRPVFARRSLTFSSTLLGKTFTVTSARSIKTKLPAKRIYLVFEFFLRSTTGPINSSVTFRTQPCRVDVFILTVPKQQNIKLIIRN
jgi:hypothetical protein